MSEYATDFALANGRIARWAHRLGMQGALSVSTHDIALTADRRLPQPLTLVFVSDLHAGPTTHPAIFDSMFAEIRRIDPDVLLLGGDFVSCRPGYVEIFRDGLAGCRPRAGKYAVLGNHDLYAGDSVVVRGLQEAGVTLLINRNVALPPPFAGVSICGIDDPWVGAPDLAAAFAGAAGVRVFMTHSPDGLTLLRGQRFDVAFAGHTHGGQIALADGTPIYVPNGPLCRRYAHGQFALEDNGALIVSRGIGCSTVPIRVNADPEIVVCRLR